MWADTATLISQTYRIDLSHHTWFPNLLLVIALLLFLRSINQIAVFFTSELAITNQRVVGRSGGFIPKFVNIPLEEIAEVRSPSPTLSSIGARWLVITQANGRMTRLPNLEHSLEFREALERQIPPEDRPSLKKGTKGKRVLIGCGTVVVFLVILVGAILLGTGEYRRFLPAEEVNFITVQAVPLWQKITIEGYLGLPTNINCDDECGIWLEDPSDRENRIPLFIDVIQAGSTPSPNKMERLRSGYTESDLTVWIDTNLYVGVGDMVRVTGVRCETTAGKLCIGDVSNIEALTQPAVAAVPTEPEPTLEYTPTVAPTPLPVGAHFENPSSELGPACFGHDGFGVTCLNDSGWRVLNSTNSQLNGDTIYAITICPDGNFAFAHNGGLHVFDGQMFVQAIPSNWGTDKVHALVCDAEGYFLVSHSGGSNSGGLSQYDGIVWTNLDIADLASPEDPNDPIVLHDLVFDLEGNLWAVVDRPNTDGSVAKYDGADWTLFGESSDLELKTSLIGIDVDLQGKVWVVYEDGLIEFEGEEWTLHEVLEDVELKDIFIDSDDRIWLAASTGFGIFDEGNWNLYNIENEGQTANSADSIATDEQGRVWVSTGWGLTVFDGGEWLTYHMHTSDISANRIISMGVRAGGPPLPDLMEKEGGAITGRLLKGGQPVAGTTVQFCVQSVGMFYSGATPCSKQPFVVSSESDENGNFTVEVPPGHYYLVFQSEDGSWTRLTGASGFFSKLINVHPGETVYMSDINVSE